MIEIIDGPSIGRADRRTHARALYSGRQRAHVLPLSLFIVVLRAFAMERRNQKAKAHNAAVCERLAAAFDDYLVSDECGAPEHGELSEVLGLSDAELIAAEAGYPFVSRRIRHEMKNDRVAMTGRKSWPWEMASFVAYELWESGLDAPGYLAAGSMRRSGASGEVAYIVPTITVRA